MSHLHFGESLVPSHGMFYKVTTDLTHDLTINAQFVDYVRMLWDKNNNIKFEFFFINAQNNYADFIYYLKPNEKVDEIKNEEERRAYNDWNSIYEQKFKFSSILVDHNEIKKFLNCS